MVSIESSKRYHIDLIPEQSKRGRYSISSDTANLINLVSPFASENLARLKTLFPCKSHEELSRALDESCNSFELALMNLQSIEKQKYADELVTKQAQEVVKDLSFAKSMDDALGIVKKVIQTSQKVEVRSDKDERIAAMHDHLKNVISENVILKKAIVKLNEFHRESNEKDKEIFRIEKELEFERCRSYSLSIQLSQAMIKNEIKPNKNIF